MLIETKEQLFDAVDELVNQGMLYDLQQIGGRLTGMDVAECGVDTVFAQQNVQMEVTDAILKELAKKMKYYI
jgi:hypothetical protein